MIDVIQHYRPLVLSSAADAELTSNRRMLAVKENVGKSQALKHGRYSRETVEFRRRMRELLREASELIEIV